MIKVQVPKDKAKIERQIEALEWQITQDKNDKDREIHQKALKELKKALNGNVEYSETVETFDSILKLDGEETIYPQK